MLFLVILVIVALGALYVAWRHDWNWSATATAIGAAFLAIWQALTDLFAAGVSP